MVALSSPNVDDDEEEGDPMDSGEDQMNSRAISIGP